jgi:hypothetical protein
MKSKPDGGTGRHVMVQRNQRFRAGDGCQD